MKVVFKETLCQHGIFRIADTQEHMHQLKIKQSSTKKNLQKKNFKEFAYSLIA